MNLLSQTVNYISILFILFFIQSEINASDFDQAGRCVSFNFDWRFYLGEVYGANNPEFNDSGWRQLNLPHDWSIEGKFSPENASCTGYLPGGIGWYRKEFNLPETYKNKNIEIQFDGVYQNAEVWINGHYLGKRPYGFISFYYNLTPYLRFGNEKNKIVVRVDHTHIADSRWYTGSGIYRNVWLYITDQIHISHWGTYVTTPEVNTNFAQVRIITSVENNSTNRKRVTLNSIIKNAEGNIADQVTSNISFQPSTKYDFEQSISIKQPMFWSLNNPYLYSVISEVYDEEELLDRDSTSFGIRTILFDAETGFYLNGESTLIKGVCLHNDVGALGSVVPKREWERRLMLMKEIGANSIRTSHNPPAPEFLDLCDQMGFLVMDEAFDEWEIGKKKWMKGWNVGQNEGAAGLGTYYSQDGYSEFFEEWSKKDLQDMIRRDRNHPSIILWSIGNEIDYPNDPYTDPTRDNYQPWRPGAYRLTEIAHRLYNYIKELDTTRPVTAALANIPLSNQTGYAALLDVVGYNYQEQYYDQDHKQFPKRKILGSENGDSYDAWLSVKDNKFIPAQFLWTGIDYLGEAGRFPSHSNVSGLVDLSDYKKPGFYYRKSLWTNEPMVYISAVSPEDSLNRYRFNLIESWNWEDYYRKNISILAFTNCDSVELFFQTKADHPSAENENSLGTRSLKETKHAMLNWEVPFNPGILKARAYKNGKAAAEYVLKTTGRPEKIILESDGSSIYADGEDIASVKVLVVDHDGNVVPDADIEVTINVTGAGFNAGLGNGDNKNTESYKDNRHHVYQGKARLFIQSNGQKGDIQIEAASNELSTGKLSIEAK